MSDSVSDISRNHKNIQQNNITQQKESDFETAYNALCAARNIFVNPSCTGSLTGQLALTNTLRQIVRSLVSLICWSQTDPVHIKAISDLQVHLEEIRKALDRD